MSRFIVFLCLLVTSCSPHSEGPQHEPLSPALRADLTASGVAIAPVAGVNIVGASPDVMGFVGEELFVTLQARLPGTPVIAPAGIYARLSARGADAHARLRALRRRVVREEALSTEEARVMATDLDERWLLVSWLDEGRTVGTHNMDLDDYEAFNYDIEVHRYPTGAMRGAFAAALVDLEAGLVVWRASLDYTAEGLDGATDSSRRIVTRARGDAAGRMSEQVALAAGR